MPVGWFDSILLIKAASSTDRHWTAFSPRVPNAFRRALRWKNPGADIQRWVLVRPTVLGVTASRSLERALKLSFPTQSETATTPSPNSPWHRCRRQHRLGGRGLGPWSIFKRGIFSAVRPRPGSSLGLGVQLRDQARTQPEKDPRQASSWLLSPVTIPMSCVSRRLVVETLPIYPLGSMRSQASATLSKSLAVAMSVTFDT